MAQSYLVCDVKTLMCKGKRKKSVLTNLNREDKLH